MSADGRSEINQRLMEIIHQAMRRDGLARRQIEHMADVSSPTVSDWFNNGAVPDAVVIGRLCRGLRVNAHYVITGQGPKSPPGEGNETADELFALGAAAVLQDHRDLFGTLERRWSASLLTHEDAIRRAQVALEVALRERPRIAQTPARRKKARTKRAG